MPDITRKVIWKFAIKLGKFSLDLCEAAKVISVGLQENAPQLWAETYPNLPTEKRQFEAVPTGGDVPLGASYIGTITESTVGWCSIFTSCRAEGTLMGNSSGE